MNIDRKIISLGAWNKQPGHEMPVANCRSGLSIAVMHLSILAHFVSFFLFSHSKLRGVSAPQRVPPKWWYRCLPHAPPTKEKRPTNKWYWVRAAVAPTAAKSAQSHGRSVGHTKNGDVQLLSSARPDAYVSATARREFPQ